MGCRRLILQILPKKEVIRVAKKHVNADKDSSHHRAHGRRDSSPPKSNSGGGRERNVSHGKSEEHSRTPKGNRG